MSKKEAKEEIKKLIAKYERLTPAMKKQYNEATTRKDFILPLFHALGWDIKNSFTPNEVIEEESIIKGAVDYSFRLNNIPQFLLEAKALRVDLDKIEWAEQAVSYAWNMGIDWVVLTDFEQLKLFNAEWKTDTFRPNLELTFKEYLTKFDDLWLLSKESFQKGDLDKQAERFGFKSRRAEVTERLAQDLVEWREELFHNFSIYNKGKSEYDIDEAVQRILDRFIFIRSCEDRKIEPPILWQAFQKWNQEIKDYNFIKTLKPIFKKFDEKYNSNLFVPHFCEDLDTDGAPFPKIIRGLYGDKESGVKYNFAAIKPDVLGAVYEQYLGHLSRKAKEGKIAEDRAKRKKQGIYYTPTFIVDYIVENTLGKIIKEKSLTEIENLKILDPACGSGSFLIKAFDVLDKTLKELRSGRTSADHAHRKYRILTGNIYGVDLDEHAIEITRLNLLLKAIEVGHKLPLLSDNTKVGNSLISGTEKELKNYFGRDWKKKKRFNWEEEFPEIFKGKNPGFDAIIGNPPWVSLKGKQRSLLLSEQEIEYLIKKYNSDTYRPNLFEMFIWRSLSLLKDSGVFSFIVPDRLCANEQFIKLREYIVNNFSIKKLWFRVKFPGIIGDTVIFVIENKKPDNNYIEISEYPNQNITKISQDIYKNLSDYSFFYINKDVFEVFDKLSKNNKIKGLSQLAKTSVGFIASEGKLTKVKTGNRQRSVLKGENIVRYGISGNFWFEFIKDNLAGGTQDVKKLKAPYKILLRKTGSDLIASLCEEGKFYPEQSLYFIYGLNKKELIYYLLAILNSRLINIYYQKFAITNRDATPQLKKIDLDKFPIYEINLSNKQEKARYYELIRLVDKMLNLNKELQKTTEKSDKWYKIKKEIEKTDKIIDEKVYKLYSLTKEEIEIIENNG